MKSQLCEIRKKVSLIREREKKMRGTGSSVVRKRPLDERSKHGRGQAAAECISLVREEGLTSNGRMCP